MIPLLLSTYEYTAQLKGINRANQFRPWASSRAGMKRAAILEYGGRRRHGRDSRRSVWAKVNTPALSLCQT